MSDAGGILGEVLEQGTSLVKQTVKQAIKTPSDLAKAGGKQVKGSDQTQAPPQPLEESKAKERAKTKEFVEDLYGADGKPIPTETQEALKTQKEQEKELKLKKLRQELHSVYYQKLVNPPKTKEEKPAEKVEREKKEERWELEQKEKKKPPPLAVQRAAQKAEKFPGASG